MSSEHVEQMRKLSPQLADAMAMTERAMAIATSAATALVAVLDDPEAYRLNDATRTKMLLALREYAEVGDE